MSSSKLIQSAANADFRRLLDLHKGAGIKKHGAYLVFGERVVREYLQDQIPCENLLVLAGNAEHAALAKQFPGTRRLELTSELFGEIDLFGIRTPILVCPTPELPNADLERPPQGLEVLLALSDPSNLGAALRTCAAFSVSAVILLKECASPFHPKAVRAASAAQRVCPMSRGPSIKDLGDLKAFALDADGSNIFNLSWPKNLRLILGEEGQGVPNGRYFQKLAIPIATSIESLNATVAMGVALAQFRREHPAAR